MKKLILTIAVAGLISLGFTLISKETSSKKVNAVSTVQNNDFEKVNVSNDSMNKRLASWD